jgi:AraC family transcriptional regulator of adaptative response / DNA-3-methyladenine glycosylase II
MKGPPPAGGAAPAVPVSAAPPLRLLRLRVRLPAAYDQGWVLGFLADRAAPSIERVEAAGLLRVVRIDGIPVVLSVRPAGGLRASPARPARDPAARRWLNVEALLPAGISAAAVRRLVRRMFDLDVDLGPFLELARRDPLLAPLVRRHPGLRLPQLPDGFEGVVRAIVGQQVSVAAARTVVDRLIRHLGDPVGDVSPAGDSGLFAFPRPAALAAAPRERLTALGLTRAKAAALLAAAAATRDGALDWQKLRTSPPEAAHAALRALPGIGPWTAAYVRMRALGDRDAFPASDLGILKALAARNPRATRPDAAEIDALAEGWRPYRAYAAIHLWRSLSS